MDEKKMLAERFEADRGRLLSVAYRMLGSRSEAEDAVQQAWLRLAGADASALDNLRAWLTTVTARVCLDMLRARKSRREAPMDAQVQDIPSSDNAERDVLMADSVGIAMLVVLEKLSPGERVAFVLHDMFDLPFEEIAPIVGRSTAAARQLASRARRRVQGAPSTAQSGLGKRREIVAAFLTASRAGDYAALISLLDPDVVLRADAAAVAASLARAGAGAPVLAPEMRGRDAIAQTFKGRATAAQLALVNGQPGLVFAPGGRPFAVFDLVIKQDRIAEINLIADAQGIAALDLQF
jgi:RNA polymerase sigma-70 factor (ECF subfamily)